MGQAEASLAAGAPLDTREAGTSIEAGAQQLTETFRLRVQAQARRHAPTEDPVDDEVDRSQVRERVPADRKGLDLGQQRVEHVGGERTLEPVGDLVLVGPHAHVGVAPLVPRPCPDEDPQGHPDEVRHRRRWPVEGDGRDGRRRVRAGGDGRGRGGDDGPVALDVGRDGRGADQGRPVAGHALRPRGRGGEERARVARKAGLDHGAREGATDRALVVVAHRKAQVGQAATGEVARELLVRLGEGAAAAPDAGPHGVGGEPGLVRHLRAGQRERHGIAPTRVEIGRYLQGGRRRLPAHSTDPHPVRPGLCELDGVEAGHGVRAEVAPAPDLVEQLGGDRPDRHGATCPRMLGDHRRAVPVHLRDGKADPFSMGHLLEEGVVAAAALGAALDHMAGHDGTGDGVEVGVGPSEGVQ